MLKNFIWMNFSGFISSFLDFFFCRESHQSFYTGMLLVIGHTKKKEVMVHKCLFKLQFEFASCKRVSLSFYGS